MSSATSRALLAVLIVLASAASALSPNKRGQGYQITPKACQVDRVRGVCMFVWECIRHEGEHLGMCMDSFMFGSCCLLPADVTVPTVAADTAAASSAVHTAISQQASSSRPAANAIHGRPSTKRPTPNRFGATTAGPPNPPQKLTSKLPPGPFYSTKHPPSNEISPNPFLSTKYPTTPENPQNPFLSTKFPENSLNQFPSTKYPPTLENSFLSTKFPPTPPESNFLSTKFPPTPENNFLSTKFPPTPESNFLSTKFPPAGSQFAPPEGSTEPAFVTRPKPHNSFWQTSIRPRPPDLLPGSISGQRPRPPKPTPAGTFITKPTPAGTFITKPTPAGTFITKPTPIGTFITKKPQVLSSRPDSSSAQFVTATKPPTTPERPPTTPERPPSSPERPPTTPERPPSTSELPPIAIDFTAVTTRRPTSEPPALLDFVSTTPLVTRGTTENGTLGGSTPRPIKNRKECGVPPLFPRPEMRIVGGSAAPFGGWPWQVSVRRTSFFGFSSTHRCGGAVLNENWIATAGHCVDDLLTSQIRIRVGEYDFSSAGEPLAHEERGVAKKVVHPRYNFFTYEYDLALVQLDRPLEFAPHVAPICLPGSDDLLVGETATVTGWGRLSEGGTLPSVLQEVSVPIVSNENCKSMFLRAGRHEHIPEIFLCAGFEDGGRDSCQGDSGGPLQVRGKDGRYFLAGIISWGIGCAESNLPGVCTRISKFVGWIMDTVA